MSILLLILSRCTFNDESFTNKLDEPVKASKLTSKDISLSAEFIEYKSQSILGLPFPDSLKVFSISSNLQNESNDTLIFLTMICAKESFYRVSPAPYKRWNNSICWSEGFNQVSLAPGENYTQEIWIAYSRNEFDLLLPDLKLGFLFQYNLDIGKMNSFEVWSGTIEIPYEVEK